MEKYTGKNNKRKMKYSLIEKLKRSKDLLQNGEMYMTNAEHQIDQIERSNLSPEALSKLNSKKAKYNKLCYDYYHLKKSLKRAVAILSATLIIGTPAVISTYSHNKSNQNFIDTTNQVYSYVVAENEDPSNPSYEAFKDDIVRYVELNKQDNLSSYEKDELSNIKSRIKSNPAGMNKLSLDILKQKIASSIGIEDYSRLTIIDKSGIVQADKYHDKSGEKTDVSILLDNKPIASTYIIENLSSGEVYKESEDIPKDVLDTIFTISNAQVEPYASSQNINDSLKALKKALSLDEKSINFKLPITRDEGR